MSNWDDEEWDTEKSTAPSSFMPGPPGATVAASWDDEDQPDEKKTVLKKKSAPMKPAKQRAKALKEKEEKERQKEIEKILNHQKELDKLDAIQKKLREQQLVEEADLQHAKELFMVGDASEGMGGPKSELTLDSFKPVTPEDYSKFAKMLGERCAEMNQNPKKTNRYIEFVKEMLRVVVKDLGLDDTKSISTFVGLLGNEKREEFKRSRGIKKKVSKKTNVRVDKMNDMREDVYDDFADDFM